MESEFFGYVKGAFTGATSDRMGKLEQADGGVLFLDEIAEMPLSIQ
jgi:transcriptional regulator with GAF, ATPase, and Fis domain